MTLYDNPWTLLLSSSRTEIKQIYGSIKFRKIPIPLLRICLNFFRDFKTFNSLKFVYFFDFFITIFYFPSEWTTTWRMRFLTLWNFQWKFCSFFFALKKVNKHKSVNYTFWKSPWKNVQMTLQSFTRTFTKMHAKSNFSFIIDICTASMER